MFDPLQEMYFICSYLVWGEEIHGEPGSEKFPEEHSQSPHQKKGKESHPQSVFSLDIECVWSERRYTR